jgi:ribosomal protein L11 methyltransferase
MSEREASVYIEARVEVPRHLADAVCNHIVDNIASGLVLDEEDGTDVTGITFYVSQCERRDWRTELNAYLLRLTNGAAPSILPVSERLIENIEWQEEYKKSATPTFIGSDIVIRPPWYALTSPITYDIIIEPKMAFGTGSHETTRSCLKNIRDHFRPGMRFLDIGCGSGVLSILADKMGAGYIKAIDNDLAAIQNSRENFDINEVSTPHDVRFGSIESCHDDPPYDFVCANIIKKTIVAMLPELFMLTAAKGILVLSGLLDRDESEVSSHLRNSGFTSFTILRDNEWLTYTVHKG